MGSFGRLEEGCETGDGEERRSNALGRPVSGSWAVMGRSISLCTVPRAWLALARCRSTDAGAISSEKDNATKYVMAGLDD